MGSTEWATPRLSSQSRHCPVRLNGLTPTLVCTAPRTASVGRRGTRGTDPILEVRSGYVPLLIPEPCRFVPCPDAPRPFAPRHVPFHNLPPRPFPSCSVASHPPVPSHTIINPVPTRPVSSRTKTWRGAWEGPFPIAYESRAVDGADANGGMRHGPGARRIRRRRFSLTRDCE